MRTGPQVREALAGFAPDLVHVTSPGRVGRKALKHASRLGFPTLLVEQSHVPQAAAEPWLRRSRSHADHAVVTSRWMHAELTAAGIEPPPVWSPGVDLAAYGPQLRDDRLHARWARERSSGGPRVVVGHVGGLRRRHGVRRLVEVDQVPGTRLVVVGDGPQRRWLTDRMPDATFPGTLTGGDLATALASLDVLVHPGEEETCCHVLREAAASGVPVVAPASGGTLDAVRHGPHRAALRPGRTREACAARWPPWSATRTCAPSSGGRHGPAPSSGPGGTRSRSWSTCTTPRRCAGCVAPPPEPCRHRPVSSRRRMSHSPGRWAAAEGDSVASVATPTLVKGSRSTRSTIALKLLMAVSGLVFIGFVLLHMYGNLKAFAGHDAYNEYAHHLRTLGEPMLPDERVALDPPRRAPRRARGARLRRRRALAPGPAGRAPSSTW